MTELKAAHLSSYYSTNKNDGTNSKNPICLILTCVLTTATVATHVKVDSYTSHAKQSNIIMTS